MTIYCGGPIDMATGDPDRRHRELMRALIGVGRADPVYCPLCQHRALSTTVEMQIGLNTEHLMDDEWAVFVWDARSQPSIGTPIELYQRAVEGMPSVVVGSLGVGMFQAWLEARGVVVVDDIAAAARLVTA